MDLFQVLGKSKCSGKEFTLYYLFHIFSCWNHKPWCILSRLYVRDGEMDSNPYSYFIYPPATSVLRNVSTIFPTFFVSSSQTSHIEWRKSMNIILQELTQILHWIYIWTLTRCWWETNQSWSQYFNLNSCLQVEDVRSEARRLTRCLSQASFPSESNYAESNMREHQTINRVTVTEK